MSTICSFSLLQYVGIHHLTVIFVNLSQVFAVGLSVTILILASDGLGVLAVLTLRRADAIQKGYYASNFLYILTLGFAKLSLVSFFYSVHHQRGQRRAVLAIGIFILAWTLASLAAVAFQCGLPKPWEVLTLHCYNIVSMARAKNSLTITNACLGGLLDCLLHHRHDQRRRYRHAIHQSGSISQGQNLEQDCGGRMLCATHPRNWRCTCSLDIPFPDIAARQSCFQPVGTTDDHANSSLLKYRDGLHTVCTRLLRKH